MTNMVKEKTDSWNVFIFQIFAVAWVHMNTHAHEYSKIIFKIEYWEVPVKQKIVSTL